MSFPLRIAGRRIGAGQELVSLFVADARARGDTVVPGQAPHAWILGLVDAGQLPREVVSALAAVLLNSGAAPAVAEAARLAVALGTAECRALFPAAVDAQDTSVLLHADPFVPGSSVEDALLRAWASLARADDPAVRADLLDRLRNAGLPAVEAEVLARYGTPEELRAGVEQILAEGVPTGVSEALFAVRDREDSVQDALRGALAAVPADRWPILAARVPAWSTWPR